MNKENLEKIFNDDLGTSYFPLLAEEYIKDKDYMRAKKVCNVGLLLNPSNNDGKFILAKLEMIEGNGRVAVDLLKDIIKSDNLYINAMRMLVMHYNSKGTNQVEMIKLIHNILDLIPDDEYANEILKSAKKASKKKVKTTSTKRKPQPKKKTKKESTLKNKRTKGKPENIDINIDSKMATLTFVDILIKQKQYAQAKNVLKLVSKNKSIARSSIKQREIKIKKELSKEI